MIYGLYLSHWTTIDPAKFVNTNNTIDLDFAIIRAAGAGKDDSKFTPHRTWARNAKMRAGGLIWGADMYLGYAPNDPTSKKQVDDFWTLINAGGKEWEINPEIDIEYEPKEYNADGTVKNYWPAPANFVEANLKPAVYQLGDYLGHEPTLYLNLRTIKEFLTKNYTVTLPEWLLKCPLHVASYTTYDAPQMNPPDKTYWTAYQFWQFTNTTNWTGATSVCMEKRPGTRAELKEWCKAPSATWKPGDVVTPPPVPEPEPQPGDGFTAADREVLAAIRAGVDRLAWLGK